MDPYSCIQTFEVFLEIGGVRAGFWATWAARVAAVPVWFITLGALFFQNGKTVFCLDRLSFSALALFRVPFYLTFTPPKVRVAVVQAE